jgi:hypothetical protein
MKQLIISLICASCVTLLNASDKKPEILKTWQLGKGTLKLLTLPGNGDSELGLWWRQADGAKSSYGAIYDLAKLIRSVGEIENWKTIKSGELKVHWTNEIIITFREKEVIFKFGSCDSFTLNWPETNGIAKAIEDGREKLKASAPTTEQPADSKPPKTSQPTH